MFFKIFLFFQFNTESKVKNLTSTNIPPKNNNKNPRLQTHLMAQTKFRKEIKKSRKENT